MRMNKKKFMQTAMGMEIESTIRTWDSALEEKRKQNRGMDTRIRDLVTHTGITLAFHARQNGKRSK